MTSSGERIVFYPAGDCAHCGQPIEETHMLEGIAFSKVLRQATILIHTGSGHERCEGRDTLAERVRAEGVS